ncbi:MAG: hypothetical protein KJ704_02105 [Proteobacteria bacterium]|nr:hypothetical protein [Pseudomonadota bacterium]
MKKIAAALNEGKIKGIAILAGTNNVKFTQDLPFLTMAQEFLKNDILCISEGDASVSLAKYGFLNPPPVREALRRGCRKAPRGRRKESPGRYRPRVCGERRRGRVPVRALRGRQEGREGAAGPGLLRRGQPERRGRRGARPGGDGRFDLLLAQPAGDGEPEDDGGPLEALRRKVRCEADRPYGQEDGAVGEGADDPEGLQPRGGSEPQGSSLDRLEEISSAVIRQ